MGLTGGCVVAQASETSVVATAMPGCCLGTVTVHSEHHVFWVVQGAATVLADGRVFHLGALDALWLPGGAAVDHVSTDPGTVALTVLLPAADFPDTVDGVVHRKISPELSILLVHLFGRWLMPAWDGEKLTDGMATVLREAFFGGRAGIVDQPRMPVSTAAVMVARKLFSDPGDPRSREQWAVDVGLSERHLDQVVPYRDRSVAEFLAVGIEGRCRSGAGGLRETHRADRPRPRILGNGSPVARLPETDRHHSERSLQGRRKNRCAAGKAELSGSGSSDPGGPSAAEY